jgi:hypothetical protein
MEELYETLLFEKAPSKGFGMLSQEEDSETLDNGENMMYL